MLIFSFSSDRPEQLHALLASEARYKWADMSKVSHTYRRIYRYTENDSLNRAGI